MNGRARALYPAERRYLLDAARGLTAAESASRHQVSVSTVNSGLKCGKAALRARNITHAVALCLALGEFNRDDLGKADDE